MNRNWRSSIWVSLDQAWDLIVIGGGITGAAIFRRAVSAGWKTLLVEANDFSSGTSSRSSKLVHGGFRYLKNKQWDVTYESVKEREWLLKSAPQLVTPLPFALPYSAKKGMKSQFQLGVLIYDAMAPKWAHRHLSRKQLLQIMPEMESDWLLGAYKYYDAAVDDSMLVNRLISESVSDGGTGLNYTRAVALLRNSAGNVQAVAIEDQSGQQLGSHELKASLVINATGPFSDSLRKQLGAEPRIRPLRGSHLIFPRERLPIPMAATIMHPKDHRAMFAIPWEGSTIVGTTDLDHHASLESGEPWCSQEEIEYILEAANANFPRLNLDRADILSSFAGVRPIIHGGAANPSGESRKHEIFHESGLITITGGKLTIFRIMAEETMALAAKTLGKDLNKMRVWFKPLPHFAAGVLLDEGLHNYLSGRYGPDLPDLISQSRPEDQQNIGSLPNIWAELQFAASHYYVEHLDDLLLRRVRLGLLLPQGGFSELERVKALTSPALGWSEQRWQAETERYNQIYQSYYSPSPKGI